MTENQLLYLRSLARQLIDDADQEVESDVRDDLWETFSQSEKDEVNALVEGVFEEWL